MTPVVLMAGGRGLRLHPLTEHAPKPMLKVGGRPILEQIIDGFTTQGFRNLWLCVNYKADLITGHFGDGSSRGIKINYIHETEPMGTGGAIRLLPTFKMPFIVSNADVLTRIKYGDLLKFHARAKVDLTMCLGLYQYQVPYGVAEIEDDRLKDLREKPIESWPVNAGIYVVEPRAVRKAPEGRFDMTDLIGKLRKIATYQIEGYWCDIGAFQDLATANQAWEP